MSKKVQATWECSACESQNPVWITKPNSLIPCMAKVICESCDSKFLIEFLKEPGKHSVKYCVRRADVSPSGIEQMKSKKQTPSTILPAETKETSHV